jgi:WD40 repeat protein/serine/threonine protein kinase
MDNLTGKSIRGYVLREKVGEGGFGAVYKAFQESVERDVAIKIIRSEYSNQPDFIRRFEAEAQIIARLEHIHIIPLYDYWRDPDGAYLVMRWISGGNVRETFQYGAWELDAVLRIINQLAAALHIAHRRGIVHRDIKPENILIDASNNYFLTDFGIAIDTVTNQTVTHQNIAFGSPAYISPEQITSGIVTPMADIYGLGILLYELLTGDLPFDMPTKTQFLKSHVFAPVPSLKAKRTDLPPEIDNIIWQATSKAPNARYANVLSLAAALRKVVESAKPLPQKKKDPTLYTRPVLDLGTVDLSTGALSSSAGPRNPYKGLRAFEEGDAEDFFGRDSLTSRVIKKLADCPTCRFLAVVGPSGSGKSSLVKAGLLPILRKGQLLNSNSWFVITITPGPQPFHKLADALLRIAAREPEDLLTSLTEDETGLSRLVKTILPTDDSELLLVIDQFEEIFTLLEDAEKRDHFLKMLYHAVTVPEGALRVVITLRADYYDRPLLHPTFGDLIREHTEVVLPLVPSAIEEAIIAPAIRSGLKMEPGLSVRIADDVGHQPGALPLLQYALTELFEKREDNMLTLAAYEQIGGISGALARRAEEIYTELGPREQELTRQMFLRLIALGNQNQATRRRVFWADVISVGHQREAMQTVIDKFGQYRLLTFDRDPITRTPTIEVAHEALIREWVRLKEWIEENRNQLHIQRQLSAASSEWTQSNRDDSFLAAGSRLAQFETLLTEEQLALNEHERDYIQHSIKLREKSVRRMRLIAGAFALFSVFALVLAVVAFYQQDQAETASIRANTERDRANQNAQMSRSRELAAAAQANLSQVDLALLLSSASVEVADTFEARESLLVALQNAPFLSCYLHGHTDAVRAVAFSPDGQSLISGGRDDLLIRWDLITRQPIGQPLGGHTNTINSVAFSSDGQFMASGSADKTIRLWDAATGVLVDVFDAHTDVVWSVAFSPDAELLVSGSADGTIIRWDLETGQMIGEPLEGHSNAIYSVAFSPDGTLLASGSADGTIRLWDVTSGELVGEPLVGHTNWVLAVAFSPDGRILASSGIEASVFLWDVVAGELFEQFPTGHGGWTRSLAFSANGQVIATANTDGTVRLWETATRNMISQPLQAHVNEVWSVAFSPTEFLLASGNIDGSVLTWDITSATAPARTRFVSVNEITVVAASADGEWIASGEGSDTAASPEGTVRIWNAESGELRHSMSGHAGPITDVAFSPDGSQVISAGSEGLLMLWDAATGELVGIPFIGHNAPVRQVLFMADNQTVISAGDDGRILFWDTTTSVPQSPSFPEQPSGILSLALASDEQLLVSGGRDGSILLWDITAEVPEAQSLEGHADAITGLTFGHDGKLLISSSRDGTIMFWDVETLEAVGQPLTGHGDWVLSVALSPDGTMLASGSRDQSILLWDMSSGRLMGTPLSGHLHWVNSVTFNPVDGTLVSGSRDNTILTWEMDVSTWRQFACQIANRGLTAGEQQRYLHEAGDTMEICP